MPPRKVRQKKRPAKPVRIAIVNHKGGVGKTSLTVNLAYALAEAGKRVLVVDADPQCNATSYLVDDLVVDEMLDKSDEATGQTIWSAVKPLFDASGPLKLVEPIEISSANGALFLVAGDIQLTEFEASLAQMWVECFQRRPRAFAVVHALSSLVAHISASKKIDFVLYDSAPSIGALNKVVTLDCDYFLIPAACDSFSVRAIKTLGRAIASWMDDWATIVSIAPDGVELLPGHPNLLGYVLQRVRVYGQQIVADQAANIPNIERQVASGVVDVLRQVGGAPQGRKALRLGMVDDLGGLMSAAQREGCAAWAVPNKPAPQRLRAKKVFQALAAEVLKRV